MRFLHTMIRVGNLEKSIKLEVSSISMKDTQQQNYIHAGLIKALKHIL